MARYQDAIDWIAYNDDTSEIEDGDIAECIPTVTIALVCDLWNKATDTVIADIRKALKKRPEQ